MKAMRKLRLYVLKFFRPKVIVPDTNILVDNLGDIRTLAEYGDFSLKVPTTVLVELEGLSKDTARQEVSPGLSCSEN